MFWVVFLNKEMDVKSPVLVTLLKLHCLGVKVDLRMLIDQGI